MDKKQKKKKGGGAVVGIGLVLLLLAGGAGYGFGSGMLTWPAGAALPALAPVATEAPDSQQEDGADVAQGPQEILVSEGEIRFQGKQVTVDALKDKLLAAYDESTPWELVDDHALKADYDAVKALLDELDMGYVEK